MAAPTRVWNLISCPLLLSPNRRARCNFVQLKWNFADEWMHDVYLLLCWKSVALIELTFQVTWSAVVAVRCCVSGLEVTKPPSWFGSVGAFCVCSASWSILVSLLFCCSLCTVCGECDGDKSITHNVYENAQKWLSSLSWLPFVFLSRNMFKKWEA